MEQISVSQEFQTLIWKNRDQLPVISVLLDLAGASVEDQTVIECPLVCNRGKSHCRSDLYCTTMSRAQRRAASSSSSLSSPKTPETTEENARSIGSLSIPVHGVGLPSIGKRWLRRILLDAMIS